MFSAQCIPFVSFTCPGSGGPHELLVHGEALSRECLRTRNAPTTRTCMSPVLVRIIVVVAAMLLGTTSPHRDLPRQRRAAVRAPEGPGPFSGTSAPVGGCTAVCESVGDLRRLRGGIAHAHLLCGIGASPGAQRRSRRRANEKTSPPLMGGLAWYRGGQI